jgi:hypothetical protein
MGRLEASLGVVGILALATTFIIITGWNPLPSLLDWVERAGSISRPEPAWKVRSSERPEYAVVAGRTVTLLLPGGVEARDAADGEEIWSREAPWASTAGADSAVVVVVGRQNQRGFEVIDPDTGAVRWDDSEASGVWTYREAVLSLACKGLEDCTLSARDPVGGTVRWRTVLPGIGKTLAGLNHELLGSRELEASTVDPRVGSPPSMPPMLGFPLDGRTQVVDTRTGRRVREAESEEHIRVVVVSGRLLRMKAERSGGQCRYSLEARDPVSGASVWRRDGYDLRTASGAGCEQRRDPSGGGGTLAAIRGDNREVLLNAADGRELWVGEPGERVLATDGVTALVRSADKKVIKAADLGRRSTLWQQEAAETAGVALTRHAALIVEDGRLRAFEVDTGRLVVDARTGAKVIGSGPDALVLASGRTVGLLPFGSINR